MFISLPLLAGNDARSIQKDVNNWESPWRGFNNLFEFNPAATYTIPINSFSRVGTSYSSMNNDDGLHLVQEGSGSSALKLFSESFEKDSKYHFFGKAEFISDQKKNVGWRDVEDYELLSPYVIADSVGGTYKRESYSLSGGSSLKNKNMEYALRASYQGAVSYRQVDPRPRNTVSVISINPGITFQKENWKVGWFGEYKRYRQNVDIQVEKEGRKIYFYLLQGFGIYNHNFSGYDDNFSRIYKGNLYTSGINFELRTPKNSSELILWLNRDDIDAVENSNRTPYKITHNVFNTQLTHEMQLQHRSLFLKGLYSLNQTIGNETQYKPVTISATFLEWQFASQSDRYQQLINKAQFSALFAKKDLTNFSVWQQIDLNWQSTKQNYYYPYYNLYISDITVSGSVGFIYPLKKSSVAGGVNIGYKKNLSSSLFQEENTLITRQLILPDFYFLSSDISFYQLNLKYRFCMYKNILANISVVTGWNFLKDKSANFTNFSFAFNF